MLILAPFASLSLREITPAVVQQFFSSMAGKVAHPTILKIRDALVAGFGLKTAKHLKSLGAETKASRVGIFNIYSSSQTEIVLGEDDKHLDFRLSVLCSGQPSPKSQRHLIVSTVVHCHNRLGRLYIRLVAPFHRVIVPSALRRAAHLGWPLAEV